MLIVSVMDLDSARTQAARHNCRGLSCLGYWRWEDPPHGQLHFVDLCPGLEEKEELGRALVFLALPFLAVGTV